MEFIEAETYGIDHSSSPAFRAEANSGEGGGIVWGDKEIKQVYVAKGIHIQIHLP